MKKLNFRSSSTGRYEIWFKAVAVATILRYKNTMKSIRDHVDSEDKRKLSELGPKSKQNETDPLKSKQNESFWLKTASESKGSKTDPLKRNEGNTIYINESGLYCLILRSKLEYARIFKRWVTKEVLPSIRKTGKHIHDDVNHKYSASLTFKIENETDLHTKVVSFLKKRYHHSIFSASLGENQDTVREVVKTLVPVRDPPIELRYRLATIPPPPPHTTKFLRPTT